MKVDKKTMKLYVVTNRAWLGDNKLADQVEQTIKAGTTFVQLREKHLSDDEFIKVAMDVKVITDKYKIPFVINDNVNVAITVNADGIHIGQSDMEAKNVRALIGDNKILGVSVQTVEQAIKAEKSGADYLGVGAVFSTSTKTDADIIPLDLLRDICSCVSIPIVAIGGITKKNIMKLAGSGVDGVAVVSAIFAQSDIHSATSELVVLSDKLVNIL